MRLRSTAACLAVVAASGFMAVDTAAAATTGTVLHVDNATAAHCSDQTADSSVTPYCTIQAAVNAATAGDTVQVKGGDTFTAETDVTTSGTSSAPITIESTGGLANILATNDQYGFYVNGAQYIDLSGFRVVYAKSAGVQLSGAQHIDVSGMQLISASGSSVTGDGVALYQTSDSEVSTSYFQGAYGNAAVSVYGGGTGGDIVTTNVLTGQRSNGILDTAVPDVAITSNTVVDFCGGTAVSVEGGEAGLATGATIENNILADFSCGTIAIEGDSQEVAAADYNIIYPGNSTSLDYYWLPTASSETVGQYNTSAAFCSATGYGCADLNTNPDVNAVETADAGQIESENSSAIDSANSDATGELATDFAGNARTDDPNVPNTGVGTYSYYDRGAYQYQDPFVSGGDQLLVSTSPVDVFSTAITTSIPAGTWGPVEYTYDYGDGSSTTTTASTETHHYAKLGTYTVTVTAKDSTGVAQTATAQAVTAGSEFTAFGPARILDTRKGLGAAESPVSSGGSITLKVAGAQGLPSSGITAVALHVTAVDTTGSGFVTVAPGGETTNTSLLNFGAGQTVSNSTIVPVAPNGEISLGMSGVNSSVRTDLIADVTGYFTGTMASGYTSVSPARLLDTRSGLGGTHGAVSGTHVIKLTIAGADGGSLPASGVTAVALNLTAVGGTGNGLVTAYPDGSATPQASNLNYLKGQTVASAAIVPVGSDGKIDLYVGGSNTQSVNLIADVQGYYSASGASAYVPVGPERAIDTRKSGGPLAQNDGTVAFDPLSLDDGMAWITLPNGSDDPYYELPTDAAAWDFNLTAVQGTAHGLITAYPVLSGSTPVPAVSNVNYGPNQTVANFAQVTGGPADPWQSSVDFTNAGASGTVQLIADLYGFYGSN